MESKGTMVIGQKILREHWIYKENIVMEVKCPMCGAPIENGHCSYCGYVVKKPDNTETNVNTSSQQTIYSQAIQANIVSNNSAPDSSDTGIGVSTKSKTIALILCLFLGFFGVHRFYVGDLKMGKLYLCTFGLFFVGWIIDIIRIANGSLKDSSGLPLQ